MIRHSSAWVLGLALFLVSGCGGSGSSGVIPPAVTPESTPEVGAVALLVTDAPSSDLSAFTATLRNFELVRDGERTPLAGPERRINLLEFEGRFLFDSHSLVEAGVYDALAVTIDDIVIEPNPLGIVTEALTGEILVYPDNSIEVTEGRTLLLEFDFDVASSFDIQAGLSPRFRVKPVVSVSVAEEETPLSRVEGTLGPIIGPVVDGGLNGALDGESSVRELVLVDEAGIVPVRAAPNAWWGGHLQGLSWGELPDPLPVIVWGHIDGEGIFHVDVLTELGRIVQGTVTEKISDQQWVIRNGDESLVVRVDGELIWGEEGRPVLAKVIRMGDHLTCHIDASEPSLELDGEFLRSFRASLVHVSPRYVYGTLSSLTEIESGAQARVNTADGGIQVLFDSSTLLRVRGIGTTNSRFLTPGVELKVALRWEEGQGDEVAAEVLLEPQLYDGQLLRQEGSWVLIQQRERSALMLGKDTRFGWLRSNDGDRHTFQQVSSEDADATFPDGAQVRILGIRAEDGVLYVKKITILE